LLTELIYRLFIKEKDNISDKIVRQRYGTVCGIVGIVANFCLFLVKLIAGLISSSVSIIADGINNLSDALSSVITILGFRLGGKKPDRDHPFGHGRAEYVSALLVAVIIAVMGFEILKSSVIKIFRPENPQYSMFTVISLIVAVMIKLWLYLFNKKTGKKISSQTIIAASRDALSDCIATSAVLAGMFFYSYFDFNADGYIGLCVSLFILYTGYVTLKESLSPILGIAPTGELVTKIRKIVMESDEVVGMHDLVIHNYGPTRFMISLHAEVRADRDILFLHEKIDSLERKLNDTLGCESVIHMDPVEPENEEVNEIRNYVTEIIKGIDKKLSVHDFRMVKRKDYTNLIFDVTVPFEFEMSNDQLDFVINKKINEYGSIYRTVIEYDNSYI